MNPAKASRRKGDEDVSCYSFTGVSHEEQVPHSQLGTGAGFVTLRDACAAVGVSVCLAQPKHQQATLSWK